MRFVDAPVKADVTSVVVLRRSFSSIWIIILADHIKLFVA